MQSYMPVKVIIEDDVLNKHQDLFDKYNNVYLLSSFSVCEKTGIYTNLTKIFADKDIAYCYDNSVKPNPSILTTIQSGIKANQFKADCIIAIGGGSALDAGKIVAIVANNPDIDEAGLYGFKWSNKPVDLILIGTTAGTGSEVTRVAVLTNSEGQKQSVIHDDCYGKYALTDSKYTSYMSYDLTVATAIDALSHATESYFNKKADIISQSYAIECINKLFPYLIKLQKQEELTLADRYNIYLCSILGGLAINTTGTIFPHNFGYYLTERFNVPHGIACGYYLNELIDFQEKNANVNMRQFFKRINVDKQSFQQTIAHLLPDINVSITKEQLESILPRWTINNNAVNNTYGDLTTSDITDILTRKLTK